MTHYQIITAVLAALHSARFPAATRLTVAARTWEETLRLLPPSGTLCDAVRTVKDVLAEEFPELPPADRWALLRAGNPLAREMALLPEHLRD